MKVHADSLTTREMDDVFSSSLEGKQGRKHKYALSPWHDHTLLPNVFHSPLVNALFQVYAALWESWCNPPNTGTKITLFARLGGGAESAGGSGMH
jgi:hypothetical protein